MGVQSSAKTATPASTCSFFFTATAEVGEEEEEEDGGGFPTEKESHTMKEGLPLFPQSAPRTLNTKLPRGGEREKVGAKRGRKEQEEKSIK